MCSPFKRKSAGFIGYYDLDEWWHTSFNESEHNHIIAAFQLLGFSNNQLTEGDIAAPSSSAASFLFRLAMWFINEKDRSIAYRIFSKSEEIANNITVLERHFLYLSKIKIYYRFRDVDSFAMDRAIDGCMQQIALAPDAAKAFRSEYHNAALPSHTGYEQLAIIYDKRDDYSEAIELCKEAAAQGWNGTWEKRIKRYSKKLARSNI